MENFDDQILDLFENANFDSSLLNENIDKDIQKLLLDYQVLHVQNLVSYAFGILLPNRPSRDTPICRA